MIVIILYLEISSADKLGPGYFTKCLLFSSHGHTRPFVKQLFLVGTFIRIVMTKFKYVLSKTFFLGFWTEKEEEHFFFSEFLKSEESIAETFFSRFFLKGVSTLVVHSAEEERPTAAHLLSRGRPANKDTPKT